MEYSIRQAAHFTEGDRPTPLFRVEIHMSAIHSFKKGAAHWAISNVLLGGRIRHLPLRGIEPMSHAGILTTILTRNAYAMTVIQVRYISLHV